MAAAAMAYYAGVSVESIRKSVCEFVAVPHRIEYVTEKNGVAYYNDSKGTNPDAAIKGIQAMNRPTLLIGGGYAVLLSPACASWGQFDNYEQRGDMFKEYVKAL